IALKALNQLDLVSFIDSYIFKIKDLLNKPVALAVRADNRPVITRFQKSNNPIDINMEIGYSPPLLVSSVGKCFAAFSSPEITKDTIEKEIKEFNLNRKNVEQELLSITKKCYSFKEKENDHITGNYAIYPPLCDASGNIIAAIC